MIRLLKEMVRMAGFSTPIYFPIQQKAWKKQSAFDRTIPESPTQFFKHSK